MNKALFRFSSLGKKYMMALFGLFLALFLLVHLGINLCLLRSDGGAWYSAASDFMGSNYIIKVFEIVLMASFLLHILFGLIITFQNWASRPLRYASNNKSKTSFFSKYMFHTGVIIGAFLVMHFFNFYFVKLGLVDPPAGIDAHDFYQQSILLFSNKVYSLVYVAFFIFLGFHLNHAIQSAFQSLGMNHNRYFKAIKLIGTIYAIVICGGFAIIPLYFIF